MVAGTVTGKISGKISGTILDLDGRAVPLTVKRNARAKRLTLRIAPEGDSVLVTLPPRMAESHAYDLAYRQQEWILKHLGDRPERVAFVDDAVVPYLGEDLTIVHVAAQRTPVERDGGVLRVGGQTRFLSRRVTDWFKAEAKRVLSSRVAEKADLLGRHAGRVTVRDTKSRWGSCTYNGDFNFSWRLVMAPDCVLDYVAAHEAAHLVHRDHSARFWGAVKPLTDDMDGARAWLKKFGAQLHRYG